MFLAQKFDSLPTGIPLNRIQWMASVPCLVLNNNSSYRCGANLRDQTLHSVLFSPFLCISVYSCSSMRYIEKITGVGGQKTLTPIPALSLLSSCKDLREAALLFCGFPIWKLRGIFNLGRSMRGIIWIGALKGSSLADLPGPKSGLRSSRILRMKLH